MTEVVDMGIARIEDLRLIENPAFPIRSILAQTPMSGPPQWVAWVEGPGPVYGWTWFADQLLERAAMSEREIFELVVSDAVAAMERYAG